MSISTQTSATTSVRTAALVRSTQPALGVLIAPTAGHARLHHHHHHHHHHLPHHHHQRHHHHHHHHHHHRHALRLPQRHPGSPMEASSNAQTHALFQTMASATTVALVLIRIRLRLRRQLRRASTPALYIVAFMAAAHNTTSRTHGIAVPATFFRQPTTASVTTAALVRSTQPALGAPIAMTAGHA